MLFAMNLIEKFEIMSVIFLKKINHKGDVLKKGRQKNDVVSKSNYLRGLNSDWSQLLQSAQVSRYRNVLFL